MTRVSLAREIILMGANRVCGVDIVTCANFVDVVDGVVSLGVGVAMGRSGREGIDQEGVADNSG